MAFELFDRKAVREHELIGTISKNGRIQLNAGAPKKLGETKFVQVLWDKETRRCGLKASPANPPCSFKAKSHWSIVDIGLASFLNHIGYDRASFWKFRFEWDEGQGMLVFEIPAERLRSTKEVRQPKPRAPKVIKGNGIDSTQVEHGGQTL